MPTLSQYPLLPEAFITEADGQAYCNSGTVSDQRTADAIMRGINWGASMMEWYTGRRLKDRAYSLVQTVNADSRNGTLIPLDAAATSVLSAVMVGTPAYSANLTGYYNVSRAWNGTNVGLSATVTGSATDKVTLGAGRLLMDAHARYRIQLIEWPVTQAASAWAVALDGTLTAIDLTNAIIDYDEGEITLASGLAALYWFTHDEDRPLWKIQMEARCGYVQPAAGVLGHRKSYELLAQVNRDLALLYWQRFQTPSWAMASAGAGGTSGTFNKDGIPPGIMAQLAPFMRGNR